MVSKVTIISVQSYVSFIAISLQNIIKFFEDYLTFYRFLLCLYEAQWHSDQRVSLPRNYSIVLRLAVQTSLNVSSFGVNEIRTKLV